MIQSPNNKADAIRRKQKYIQQQISAGRSRNAIRKELIAAGIGEISLAYFKQVVSDFPAEATERGQAVQPSSGRDEQGDADANALGSHSPPAGPARQTRLGTVFADDRFDNDL